MATKKTNYRTAVLINNWNQTAPADKLIRSWQVGTAGPPRRADTKWHVHDLSDQSLYKFRVWSIPPQKKCFPKLIIFFWISTTSLQTHPLVNSGVNRGVNHCVKYCVKNVWNQCENQCEILWKPKSELGWKLGWKLVWKKCENCVKNMAVCFFDTHWFLLTKKKSQPRVLSSRTVFTPHRLV